MRRSGLLLSVGRSELPAACEEGVQEVFEDRLPCALVVLFIEQDDLVELLGRIVLEEDIVGPLDALVDLPLQRIARAGVDVEVGHILADDRRDVAAHRALGVDREGGREHPRGAEEVGVAHCGEERLQPARAAAADGGVLPTCFHGEERLDRRHHGVDDEAVEDLALGAEALLQLLRQVGGEPDLAYGGGRELVGAPHGIGGAVDADDDRR